MQRYIMFPNIPNYWGACWFARTPLLVCSRALVGVVVPPKLGGWGSEQSHFMCNTDNILSFFISYVIRPVLLQREGSTGVYGIQPQCVPLFRPPSP